MRLRAAMQKATQRSSKYEERALAAQKARERYLAKVAANCEEEVKKSKRIAEEMKEKREADERKLREEIEEKLAEVEKRRADLLELRNTRRPRAPSGLKHEQSRVVRDILSPDVRSGAALKIQNAWRIRTRRQIIARFIQQQLSMVEVKKRPFEMVSAVLADHRVVGATTALLAILFEEVTTDTPNDKNATTREFLSAFLISGHPAHVLSGYGDQEKDLVAKSQDLLLCFEETLTKMELSPSALPSPDQQQVLNQAWERYKTSFAAWKARDSTVLIETMIDQYVELDSMWQKIKEDQLEIVREEYNKSIKEQQVMLLIRLKKLAGPERARNMIRRAVQASRRKAQKPTVVQPSPRTPPSDRLLTSLLQPETTSSEANTVAPPPESVLPTPPPTPRPRQVNPAGHSSSRSHELASAVPSNRVLVHEIAIDPSFRVELDSCNDFELEIRSQASLIEGMRNSYHAGHAADVVMSIARYVQAQLLHLLPNKTGSTYQLILEALDPSHIKQEFATGNFSFEVLFKLLSNLLPKMCAPFRDEEVRALMEDHSGDEFDKLQRVVSILDLLRLDHTNYLLQSSAPALLKEAPGYETRAFQADLEAGRINLSNTRNWWKSSSIMIRDEQRRREAGMAESAITKLRAEKIYFEGFCDLTLSLDLKLLPETLELDRSRVQKIRASVQRTVISSAILLTAKNLLRRDVRSLWKAEAARVEDAIINSTPGTEPAGSDRIIAIIDGPHQLPAHAKQQLRAFLERLLPSNSTGITSLNEIFNHCLAEPIVRLLLSRLRAVMLGRLTLAQTSAAAAGTQDRAKSITRGNESLCQNGMAEWVRKIAEMSEQMIRISEVDRQSHGQWYEQIAAEVAAELDGPIAP